MSPFPFVVDASALRLSHSDHALHICSSIVEKDSVVIRILVSIHYCLSYCSFGLGAFPEEKVSSNFRESSQRQLNIVFNCINGSQFELS